MFTLPLGCGQHLLILIKEAEVLEQFQYKEARLPIWIQAEAMPINPLCTGAESTLVGKE